jgi:hypothetical protein
VHAIVLKLRKRKARKDVKILGAAIGHQLREETQDIGQALAIPERPKAVHWRCDHDATIRPSGTELQDAVTEIQKHRLDTSPSGRRPSILLLWSIGEEVRDAGHDANVGSLTNLLERLAQERHLLADDDLRRLHQRPIFPVHGIYVPPDVGIADESETSSDRHGEPNLIQSSKFNLL